MEKNKKSRRIRSRNAKWDRQTPGRGTYGSRGVTAKTPCVKSLDKVARNQGGQDAANIRRELSYVRQLRKKMQPRTLRNFHSYRPWPLWMRGRCLGNVLRVHI